MKTLLVLSLLAIGLAFVPAAAADHPPGECTGDEAFAVCSWHHGWHDCYYFVILGDSRGTEFC